MNISIMQIALLAGKSDSYIKKKLRLPGAPKISLLEKDPKAFCRNAKQYYNKEEIEAWLLTLTSAK